MVTMLKLGFRFENNRLVKSDAQYAYKEVRKIWEIMSKEIEERGVTDKIEQAELLGHAIASCLPVNFMQIRKPDTTKEWHLRCKDKLDMAYAGKSYKPPENPHEMCKDYVDFEIHLSTGWIIGFKVIPVKDPFQQMQERAMEIMQQVMRM